MYDILLTLVRMEGKSDKKAKAMVDDIFTRKSSTGDVDIDKACWVSFEFGGIFTAVPRQLAKDRCNYLASSFLVMALLFSRSRSFENKYTQYGL